MALRIDANGDGVLRTTNLPAIAGFTLAGWVNRSGNSGTAFGVIMYLGLSDGSDYYVLYEDSSNSYNLGMGGPSVGNWSSGIPLTNGTWTHVALVCDGTGSGNLRLYINGVLAATGDGGAGPASQLMVFGGLDGGWFSGKFEGLKIWGAALTEAEIAAEMQQSAPVRTSNINAWYPFVQSALADNYIDLSGNGYTLTPSGTLTLEANSTLPMGRVVYIGSASTPADGAAATGTSATPAVTPPVLVQAGDLVAFTAMTRDSSGQSFAISQASGQSWSSVNAIANTNIAAGMFYSRFNGSWGSNPSIAVSGGTSPYSAVMHVYRPPFPEATWAVDQAFTELDFTAPGSPFTVTITGQTTTRGHTVTLAGWFTADDNTWGSLSGTGWVVSGSDQYRNTSGSDLSATFAHKIQTAAGATGNVSKNQATLGGDAGTTFIVTFYPILSGTGGGTQGAQTVSSGGTVDIGGAGTPTQGAQTSAGAGTISITGTGAATQAGDTTTAAGSVGNDGQGAVTQGADTLASAGTVGASGIDGAGAPTQAADTAAGAGSVGVTGSGSATQGAQTAAGAGETPITGQSVVSQSGDAAAGSGIVSVGGQAAATQGADDLSAEGAVTLTGSGALAQGADSAVAAGTVGVTGQGTASQGAQTAQGAGVVPITGTGSGADGADTASAQGSVGITGSASITQGADTVEAVDEGSVSGSGAVTQDAQQATGSGTVGIGGDGSGSQEPDVIAASGDVSISGESSLTQSLDQITAQGAVSLTGYGAATQGEHTLVAVGSAGTIVYVGVTTIVGLSRTYTANAQAALTRVQDVDRLLTVEPMNTHSVESLSQSYTVEAIQ